MTLLTDQDRDARALCRRAIQHYERKANHNKSEALRCFVIIIVCTLTTPLLITLGSGLWLGKVAPSMLSLIAAAATAWLQQRKPQQLWSLYRTAQRYLEVQELKHDFGLDQYEQAEERDKQLASEVAGVIMRTHEQWVPIVPSPEGPEALQKQAKASQLTQRATSSERKD